jgi:hypothetical protein
MQSTGRSVLFIPLTKYNYSMKHGSTEAKKKKMMRLRRDLYLPQIHTWYTRNPGKVLVTVVTGAANVYWATFTGQRLLGSFYWATFTGNIGSKIGRSPRLLTILTSRALSLQSPVSGTTLEEYSPSSSLGCRVECGVVFLKSSDVA